MENQDLKDLQQKVASLEILITEKFLHLENMIENRFGHLEERNLQHVNDSLQKMNSHIDFIHETYATLQRPLSYVKDTVERMMLPPVERAGGVGGGGGAAGWMAGFLLPSASSTTTCLPDPDKEPKKE